MLTISANIARRYRRHGGKRYRPGGYNALFAHGTALMSARQQAPRANAGARTFLGQAGLRSSMMLIGALCFGIDEISI